MTWRVAIVAVLVLLATASPASAQQPPGPDGQGTDLFVTIAARQCPAYTDITANRARNNIQESLRDLGVDTPYTAGQVVNLATEESAQPNCTPITGWRFTLGTGIAGNKVIGPWGALSVVSGPYSTNVTTLASVPERDNRGRPIALRTVQGATTIELTDGQAVRAGAPGSQLWIQGGTPADPVLVGDFGETYAFGALRCATDNVNGDNVEYIKYPTGSRHVYCFAYYVVPPPTSGTIVIRKVVSSPAGATQAFTFEGNISYTADHRFGLTVTNGQPAEMTFYRAETQAGDDPWTVRELVPPGWQLTGIACDGAGATPDLDAGAVSIELVAGDTVTCTFTDRLIPPTGDLLITKLTRGGVGTFPFGVRPVGGGDLVRASATTTAPRLPVAAVPGPIDLDPGDYRIRERLPRPTRAGHWVRTAAGCNARRRDAGESLRVTISAGAGAVCQFENRFIPAGSIRILKTTRGAGATTGFVVSPLRDPELQYIQSARTQGDGDTAIARGDPTRRLRLGSYVIQETEPVTDEAGRWTLVAVTCGGRLRAFEQGRLTVTLTRARPHAVCHFINGFTPDAPPVPGPQPPSPPPPTVLPDLVVTKRALQRSVLFGSIAAYEITVSNEGQAAAEQVVLVDDPGENAQLVSARPSQGVCGERVPLICRLGPLAPGEEATVRVRVRAIGAPAIDNLAVAGSATDDARLSNNSDRARVRVRSTGGVLGGTCVRRATAVAHAAC